MTVQPATVVAVAAALSCSVAAAQEVFCVFDPDVNALVESADPAAALRVEIVKQDAVLWHWAPETGTDVIGIVQCDGATGAGTMGQFPSERSGQALAMADDVLSAQPDPLKRQMLAVRTFFREKGRKLDGSILSTAGEQGRCACLAAGLPPRPSY